MGMKAGGAATNGASANGAPNAPTFTLAGVTAPAQRAVIRTAKLTVRVDDVSKKEKSANKLILEMGGYVESANSADLATERPTLILQCRIPAGAFDKALDSFEALGTRLSKAVSSEDVTEKIVDLDARGKTMAAQEESLRSILKNVHDMDNMLTVRQKLMELREEIESMAAQRKSLAMQASYSTIELTLTQQADALAAAKVDPNWSGQAWGEAWSSAGSLGRGLMVLGIWLLAYSPIWIIIGIAVWFAVRQSKKMRTGPVAPPRV